MPLRSLHVFVASALVLAAGCGPTLAVVDEDEGEPDFNVSYAEQGLTDCTERQDTGYSNGVAFPITVVTVDGKPVERATANAYVVMQTAAAKEGVGLLIISGFRTMAQQQYLYACYTNCNCNNCNLAAKPGYSNHQSGHALDLNTGSSAAVLNWLNAHGATYGFKRTVSSEPWHWEWWGGGPGGGPCGAVDAGVTVPDAGHVTVDAGHVSVDAGHVSADAGAAEDAGAASTGGVVDESSVPPEAGPLSDDLGVVGGCGSVPGPVLAAGALALAVLRRRRQRSRAGSPR